VCPVAWSAIYRGVAVFGNVGSRDCSGDPMRGARYIVRQHGQRPSDKRVLGLHDEGLSYRLIARNVGPSKYTLWILSGGHREP
jgi:hypothetical protein